MFFCMTVLICELFKGRDHLSFIREFLGPYTIYIWQVLRKYLLVGWLEDD